MPRFADSPTRLPHGTLALRAFTTDKSEAATVVFRYVTLTLTRFRGPIRVQHAGPLRRAEEVGHPACCRLLRTARLLRGSIGSSPLADRAALVYDWVTRIRASRRLLNTMNISLSCRQKRSRS